MFAVFLDTTILFVAFPVDPRRLLERQRLDAVVGAERVHDRLRRPADPGRPPRRPRRSAAHVPDRRRRLHASPRCCAASPRRSGLLIAARVAAGRRCRRAGAVVAGPRAADLPPREGPGGRRDLGGDRRGGRCLRPDARRARRREPRLAVGVLHQPARRHRQLRARPAGAARGAGRRTPAACPIRSASCCSPAGLALARLRHREDRRLGLDERDVRRDGASSAWRCSAVFLWRCSRVSNPLLDLRAVRVAVVPLGQRRRCSSTRSGSTRCSSATCCS